MSEQPQFDPTQREVAGRYAIIFKPREETGENQAFLEDTDFAWRTLLDMLSIVRLSPIAYGKHEIALDSLVMGLRTALEKHGLAWENRNNEKWDSSQPFTADRVNKINLAFEELRELRVKYFLELVKQLDKVEEKLVSLATKISTHEIISETVDITSEYMKDATALLSEIEVLFSPLEWRDSNPIPPTLSFFQGTLQYQEVCKKREMLKEKYQQRILEPV